MTDLHSVRETKRDIKHKIENAKAELAALRSELADAATLERLLIESNPYSGKRGFAALSPEQRREVSAKGGGSKNRDPNTRTWTKGSDECVIAGRKGGQNYRPSLLKSE